VARIVTPQSLTKLEEVLEQFPRPPPLEADLLGVGLRDICSANRESERKQVEAYSRPWVQTCAPTGLTGWKMVLAKLIRARRHI